MSSSIYNRAMKLVRRYDTREPLSMAEAMGIRVRYADLGHLKGLYTVLRRNRFIVLNENLSPRMTRLVCAHELGHDQLHRALAKDALLQEFVLYNMDTQPEYEANLFAADLLLPDEEVLDYVYHYRYSADQIAHMMDSDINLIALKMVQLAQRGHAFDNVDYRSSFLKNRD